MTQIINPATLIVIAEPVDTPVEAIHDIVGRARKAQREWGPLTQTHRINALRHIADLVRANLEDIAQLETANVGKPIGDSRGEVGMTADTFDYYAGTLHKYFGHTIPVDGGMDFTVREPIGVVAVIAPWNFPWPSRRGTSLPPWPVGMPSSATPWTRRRQWVRLSHPPTWPRCRPSWGMPSRSRPPLRFPTRLGTGWVPTSCSIHLVTIGSCVRRSSGPIVAVLPFDTEEEAITLANDTIFGLSGSVWTRDIGWALRVARGIETGSVSVNSSTSVRLQTPFGDFKQSGMGRELGMAAMDGYIELKNIFVSTEV